MPRIAEEELERIKRTVDLAALVRGRGVELKKHGSRDFAGRCPFHEEDTGSFVVSPGKGLWHCMGCGAAGNVIQFVERFDGVSFRHAFELLAGGAGFPAPPGERRTASTVPRLPAPVVFEADEAALLRQVTEYYQERLWKNPQALDYLKRRGLGEDEGLLRRLGIGFADRSLGLTLPHKNRKEGADIRARLTRLGIYRESGHEHLNGCVIVPVFAADGGVSGLYGRRLDDGGKSGIRHLYLPGPHAGIFNAEALDGPEVILCEALFDALTFLAAGFANATSIYGTEGFTDELFEALKRKKVQRVKLAYDADEAGERAAARDAERLRGVGIEVYRIRFPWGMDANEYARKVTPAAQPRRLAGAETDRDAGAARSAAEGEPAVRRLVSHSLRVLIHSAAWLGGGEPPSAAPPSGGVEAEPLEPPPSPALPAESAAEPAAAVGSSKNGVCPDIAPAPSFLAALAACSAAVPSAAGAPPAEAAADAPERAAKKEPMLPGEAETDSAGRCPQGEEAVGRLTNQSSLEPVAALPVQVPPPVPAAVPVPLRASSPASVPAAAAAVPAGAGLVESGDFHTFAGAEGRDYRLAGLAKNAGPETLRITLRLRVGAGTGAGERLHSDSLDLCRDLDRRRFAERAAEECAVPSPEVRRDLGRLLLACELWQERRAALANAVSASGKGAAEAAPAMSAEEETAALELLRSPDLLKKLDAALELCGLVGEGANGRAAYLACTSRKLARPLAVIVQSTSAAGKSTLMDAALAFFPEEERIKYSAMTGQSLYYLGNANLQHKILAIVEEEGAEKASYALKLLQSEGELTIASTGKDPNTGRMETQEYHVEGPVMIFLTTTTIDIDDELLNRCLVLSVDESPAQTARIHGRQRRARTLEGLLEREARRDVLALWRNAQRLIRPLGVVNPFAQLLTFTSGRTRTRRDHEKYLTLIDAIALLHQHQRPVTTREVRSAAHPAAAAGASGAGPAARSVEFIEVHLSDIETANALAPEILGRSLDELPPQTRRLLNHVRDLVVAKMEEQKSAQSSTLFSRREVRARSGWTHAQVRAHLDRLTEVELTATRGGRNGTALLYELLTDARAPETAWTIGLLDTAALRQTLPTVRSGPAFHPYDPDPAEKTGTLSTPANFGSQALTHSKPAPCAQPGDPVETHIRSLPPQAAAS